MVPIFFYTILIKLGMNKIGTKNKRTEL